MIPLFNSYQIRSADKFAIESLSYPSIILMENAAESIYNIAKDEFNFSTEKPIGFICGKGNNAGDAFAVARKFSVDGYKIVIGLIYPKEEFSPDALTNFEILLNLKNNGSPIEIINFNDNSIKRLKKCQAVFDGIFGTGVKGELPQNIINILNKINSYELFRIAIDIPTGLNSDNGYGSTIFNSDLTITLSQLKHGLFYSKGYLSSGKVVKGSIGIPNSLFNQFIPTSYLIEAEDAVAAFKGKDKGINKYKAGKLLIIAGSKDFPGAAILNSLSAFKIGTGAVKAALPNSFGTGFIKKTPEIVPFFYEDKNLGILTEESLSDIYPQINWADVVLIGSGLGRNEKTIDAVKRIIQENPKKDFVIDADAIYPFNNSFSAKIFKNKILTPHLGEFSNLIGVKSQEIEKDVLKYGSEFCRNTKSYLILKGPRTIIFNPMGESFICTLGNPGLAKFGSGDVLAGITAGVFAQSKNNFLSSIASVFVHSLAADILKKKDSEYGFTSTDIINLLPKTIKFLIKSCA